MHYTEQKAAAFKICRRCSDAIDNRQCNLARTIENLSNATKGKQETGVEKKVPDSVKNAANPLLLHPEMHPVSQARPSSASNGTPGYAGNCILRYSQCRFIEHH